MVYDDLPKYDFVDENAALLADKTSAHPTLRWVDAAWLRDRFRNANVHLLFIDEDNLKSVISWQPTTDLKTVVGSEYENLLSLNEDGQSTGLFEQDPFAAVEGVAVEGYPYIDIDDALRVQLDGNPLSADQHYQFSRISAADISAFQTIERNLQKFNWVAGYSAFQNPTNCRWSKSKYGDIEDAPDEIGFYSDWYAEVTPEGLVWQGHCSILTAGDFFGFEQPELDGVVDKGVEESCRKYFRMNVYEAKDWIDESGVIIRSERIERSVVKSVGLEWNADTSRFEIDSGEMCNAILEAGEDCGMTLQTGFPGPANCRVFQRISFSQSQNGFVVSMLTDS